MKKYYITTPIYYPSGKFHIGTAYTTIVCDTMARFKRLQGYDVKFLTGLDEHGQKIQTKAFENSTSPQEYVDKIASDAKELWKKLDITNTDFIRTTDTNHKEIVSKVFQKLYDQGDIYLGKYSGLYCLPCETFFTQTQATDGKCPDCNRELKVVEEESYFFNMKKYENRLLEFYEQNPDFLLPEAKKNEIMNSFVKGGLEDLCISRTTFDWGIKTPVDSKHVIYVWLDALMNYVTVLGYQTDNDSNFVKYWPADLQVIGKDIIRFHAVYWPVFLMALGLELPHQLFAHNFIMMKDGKMSKSKGNVIYPDVIADIYGRDVLRYILIKSIPYNQDGEFTPEDFVNKYNGDLCNDLGNLLNRTVAMINKYQDGIILPQNQVTEFDEELINYTLDKQTKTIDLLEQCHFANSITELFSIISRSNKYIDQTEPWNLFKNNEHQKLQTVLYNLTNNLAKVAIILQAFMPDTAIMMFEQLGLDNNYLLSDINNINLENKKVTLAPTALYMRLNVLEETEKIKNIMAK